MSQQIIVGTPGGVPPANSGAVAKGFINDNFTELYAAVAALEEAVEDFAGVSDGDKGDITVSASGATWTIDNGVVTLAKQANVATSVLLGRVTASTGVVEALTGTQATTLLDVFTTSLKGLVPAASGGSTTTQFLRKDGTWAAPAGSGQDSLNATYASSTETVVNFASPTAVHKTEFDYGSGYKNSIVSTISGTAAYHTLAFRLAGGWGTPFDALTLVGDGSVSFSSGANLYISSMRIGSHNSATNSNVLALTSNTATNTFIGLGYQSELGHTIFGSFDGADIPSNFITLRVRDVPTSNTLRDVLKLIANKVVEMYGPVLIGGYAIASVPTASSYTGHTIRITDRSHRLATSDGTDWKWAGTTTTIS